MKYVNGASKDIHGQSFLSQQMHTSRSGRRTLHCIWSAAAANGLHSIYICWSSCPLTCRRAHIGIVYSLQKTFIAAIVLRAFENVSMRKTKATNANIHPNCEILLKSQNSTSKAFHLVRFSLVSVIVRLYRKCLCFIRRRMWVLACLNSVSS